MINSALHLSSYVCLYIDVCVYVCVYYVKIVSSISKLAYTIQRGKKHF